MTKRYHLFGTTILAGVLATSAPAWSQATTQQSTSPSPSTSSTQDQSEAEQLEEVVVTGSRIARPQYEGVIPGVQVGEKDIEERLFTNAGDILNDVPLVGGGASLNGTNGGQTASLGVTYIDLLNLGTARTLTLVNGRRFVSNNSATIFVSGNETGSQVDASTIPVALIDRVDILTVGGAATYGADAVSGVVNYVLKDKYEGAEINIIGGQTFEYNDAGRIAVNATVGKSFLDDRLNVAVSGEYSKIDGVLANARPFRSDNQGGISNFANGGFRNPAFTPGVVGSTAFLAGGVDGIPSTIYSRSLRQINNYFGGVVFNTVAGSGTSESTVTQPGFARIAPPASSFISGTLQQIPGAPNLCNGGAFSAAQAQAAALANSRICNFAPSALPGTTTAQQDANAARVFAFYGVTPPAGATAAQLRAAALQILQQRNPTAREYYAANPNTPLNAFAGSFLAGLPDIANTGIGAGVLPRLATPLRFNRNGDLETYTLGIGGPNTPGTFATGVGGDGANRTDSTVLRVEQERNVGNIIGSYRVTDDIRFFTENLYSDIKVTNPIGTGGLFNGVSSSSTENAAILVNVNHPFLTAQNRAALAAAGITGNFTVSRYNEDIVNDLSQVSTNKTFRTVNGFEGNFRAFDRAFNWELSHTYGKAETRVEFSAINDVAFAMAIDAVDQGGVTRCRAGSTGSPTLASYLGFYGGQVPGTQANVISQVAADGVREQVVFQTNATQALFDACQPLNIFGEGRASQAAKDFVSVRNFFNNESTQNFTQAVFGGELFNLPAGPLQFALSGEYRKEELKYTVDEITRIGATRSAPSATTMAEVETKEGGLELRVPIFGGDFTLPFFKSLEFNPSIRYTQLEGSAPSFRDTTGTLRSPSYKGDVEEVYTLAATWQPSEDILFRGNISKSVRQPSIVELFLGGQPFFTSSADPCSTANISVGPAPATRRANCITDVLNRATANGGTLTGNAGAVAITDRASAESFLNNNFTPSGAAFTGLISGTQDLRPEEGDSFTYGFVATPRFIPNFIFAADYLEITVTGALGPLLAQPAAEFCYDSASFPNNSADIGVNSCAGIRRDTNFNFTNGFELPFFNLGGTRVKAINSNFSYSMDLADVFSANRDLGRLALRGNIYYLMEYTTSGTGDFSDAQSAEDTLANPVWSTQLTALYDLGRFNARWTTRIQDATRIKSAGTPIGIEFQPIVRYDGYTLHTLSLGYDVTDTTRAQLVIDNVTDEDALGQNGFFNGAYIDNIGRRWTASIQMKF
ncbi:TonB-dependent receptor [Brevundimonas sp. WCHBH090558]|uniref:TonB-dependent receptor domain-containing protein n=1 Tax=Brevundimonas huaxiensis TaxID=2725493 RepID=UPI00162449B8|nr:TonB-dependent receptor [Brevundimonas huaxiensis]MBC1181133.1 TonB-dependent receptor [Brevundimonas huaxiensis]